MYLSPGEKLTLLVLEGDPNDWSIRIGCHKDKLWHKDSWTRWPEITHVLPLHNQMDVATPWGGLIYFVANKNAIDIDVSISGVVEVENIASIKVLEKNGFSGVPSNSQQGDMIYFVRKIHR